MESSSRRSASNQAGFTLVELMVGMGIGMLATIVIIQVISVFEAQRRTTTGSADAQTNGAIALYTVARELQMAGFPLIPVVNSPLECTTLTINGTADPTTPNRLSPVAITNGVAATGVSASDVITIRYGSSQMGGVPSQISAGLAGNVAPVVSNFGCQTGDVTLITNGTSCFMSSATAVTGTTVGNMTVTLANTSGAASSLNFACLGTWHEVTYRVNGENLERCDLAIASAAGGNCNLVIPNTNFVPIVTGIVNLQAQYGVSAAANSNQVIQWVSPSGGTWGAPAVADRNKIKAIRLAVVGRNEKMEMSAVVTSPCSSTTAAAPTGLCAWDATSALPSPVVAPYVASPAPVIDLSTGDPNWQRYRYRVFDTIVPLRNVVWSKDTL